MILNRKQGLKVFYRISADDVIVLLNALRNAAGHHVANVERLINTYLTVKDTLEPVPRDELLARVQDDLVTVIDVLPAEEYAAAHIQGAADITLSELENHLDQFDPEQEIAAYCREPRCILAFDAVARLRQKDYMARRLQDGYPEWKSTGLPVE